MAKTVIIGGVAGGATAATRLRRNDEEMEILVLERGEYISYANCGLPYYIGGVIKHRSSLLLQTKEAMKKKYNIEVRTKHEVTEIIPEQKKIIVFDYAAKKTYEETYDQLIIATGSSPVKPPIPGIDGENIFTLWTVPDTDEISQFIEQSHVKKAAIIGGGFIGLEMAENLAMAGLDVTLIELENQVMTTLDYEMARILHKNLKKHKVECILSDGVKAFHHDEKKTTIELMSGKKTEVDIVILAMGVKPNSELAKKANIAINSRGGIVVDEYFKTSKEHIYAVGDVIEVEHAVTGEKTMIPLAGPANKQARMLADTLTGTPMKYKGTLGTSVAKLFDFHVATVGINEKYFIKQGKKKGVDYETALIVQKSHAGYYPGATALVLKMIFTKDGKILGAQVIGKEGVDKRMNTIATVIRLNGTITDLTELELAYAPPFSSAKDPVNMLGYVAGNICENKVSFISWEEVLQKLEKKQENFLLLDVTEEMEREQFQMEDAMWIPFSQIRQRYEELSKEKEICIYCAIGVRAYNIARMLKQKGYDNVKVIEGGSTFYQLAGYGNK